MADAGVKRPLKRVLKKARSKQDGIKSLLDEMVKVKISEPKLHPDNPREGDVGLIAESLEENGQYTPIVIQAGTNHILRGNHTWLAARSLGWKYIHAVFVDVDDEEAHRILLADNKTGMAGGFNEELLARILTNLKSVKGTGYDQGEADALIERNRMALRETVDSISAREERERAAIQEAKDSTRFEHVPLGEEVAAAEDDTIGAVEDDAPTVGNDRLEKAEDELKGAFQLKPDMAFSKDQAAGEWEIPKLRSDLLMTYEELPEKLLAWAGSATKDWPDEDVWWLYNYGIDSTSGMRDISKVIVSFYCFDNYFENWWFYPDRYVTKLLNSGIKYAVMPDFSMHNPGQDSRFISLQSLYKSRWLARYMQEAGIKVIPNITWATEDEDFLKRHVIPTLPKKIPMLALQIQTIDRSHPLHKTNVAQTQYILDTVKPDGLLLYYGKSGKQMFDEEISYKGKVRYVPARLFALTEQAKKRKKKKGL